MANYGLNGPFKNPNEISNLWYQVTEKELEGQINDLKADLEEGRKRMLGVKEDVKKETHGIYLEESEMTKAEFEEYEKSQKKQIRELELELQELRDFVDSYHRCLERFKRDKKILQELIEDWHEYNSSLYVDYCRLQAAILGGWEEWEGERLKERRREAKQEIIKREEIERRIKKLLD